MSQFNSKHYDGDEGESQPTTFQFSKGSAPFASSANDTPASAYHNSDLQGYTNAEQVAHALHVLLNTKTWNETRGIAPIWGDSNVEVESRRFVRSDESR